ncbi:MAG: formate dehydrogenase accessory protein FdhE [Chloroflexi bacterium]|nr:formate dehydrogenase accessory protein FdhE [Chloroflexota bacterium]
MPAPPAELLLQRLERRLAVLRRTRPDLQDALSLLQLIVETQLSSPRPPRVSAFPLPRQLVAARLRDGVPLLHDQPVTLDIQFAADLFSRLLNALPPDYDALVHAATTGRLDAETLFGEALVQHADHLAQIAHSADVDAGLLSGIASHSVAPILHAYAARLQLLLDQVEDTAIWQRGYCPICGGWPLVAEPTHTTGARQGSAAGHGERAVNHPALEVVEWLRCGACGARWRSRADACQYCANTDDGTRGALRLEGERRFHLRVCDRCRGYLKVRTGFAAVSADADRADPVPASGFDGDSPSANRAPPADDAVHANDVVDARDAMPAEAAPADEVLPTSEAMPAEVSPVEFLAVDDLASRRLDLAAIERGYQRPAGCGYRIELAVPEAEWIEELA